MSVEMTKIDLCETCFENKAEYRYFKLFDGMFDFRTRYYNLLVCKKCLKKIRDGEIDLR